MNGHDPGDGIPCINLPHMAVNGHVSKKNIIDIYIHIQNLYIQAYHNVSVHFNKQLRYYQGNQGVSQESKLEILIARSMFTGYAKQYYIQHIL